MTRREHGQYALYNGPATFEVVLRMYWNADFGRSTHPGGWHSGRVEFDIVNRTFPAAARRTRVLSFRTDEKTRW